MRIVTMPYFTCYIICLGIKTVISLPEPKAHWRAYRIGRSPSSVSLLSRPNISSETTGPMESKFHMESPWDGGTKVCSKGPGHMSKMAAIPIYGKNLKKSSSPEPKGRWLWGYIHVLNHEIYIYIYIYIYKIRLQIHFFLNLQQMNEVTRHFCWHQNFVPWCCLPLPRGYVHVLNHEKNCMKSDFKAIFFLNLQ